MNRQERVSYIQDILEWELTSRERAIIQARFLNSDRVPTLEELGEKLDLTGERVRQLEASAILKLRGALSIDSEKELPHTA
jgi:DNA-directed RNA polymerase sigma subunit (sigma70/sigma32)